LVTISEPPESFPDLRLLAVGGEKCAADLARRWSAGRRFVNSYGPTEATVYVTAWEGTAVEQAPPLGRPVANVRAVVVDRWGAPAPVGVPGELLVGGIGLARGYLEQPARTAESFVPDPFGDLPGERLYRTGDLVRWRADGELDILRRVDRQVKVRGVRIEPGEVEAVLAGHPAVRECAVVAMADGGGRRLAAFAVTRNGGSFASDGLRAWMRERLPEPMVPSSFVFLDTLPLTPNGKVDRRALARIAPEPVRSGVAEAPCTDAEAHLAGIWAEVLGVERVGRKDNFFDLGGHSLLATQVVSRVREVFGAEIPLRALFEAPTVAELAARLGEPEEEGGILPPLEPVPGDGPFPLSFAQERLWILDQIEPGGTAYNMPAALRLVGALRPEVLAAVFSEIARRHAVLRTTFAVPATGGGPVQIIAPPAPVPLPLVDLLALPAREREAELRRLAGNEGGRPFDLTRGPVWRATLVRLGADEHALLMTLHHIASDAWSMGVLVREVAALYDSFSRGLPSRFPELRVQYVDYSVWQRRLLAEGGMDAALEHWRKQLAGAPVLELPTDRPRAAAPAAGAGVEDLTLPAGLTSALNALARRHEATLFMVVTAAFQALLSRYSGQTDLTVGTPVAGRARTELEHLIGFFVNTLVLRGDLGGDPAFGALLDRTRSTALAAFAHQEVPFERLVEEVNPERSLSHSPLFQVVIALQNTPAVDLEAPGLSFRPLEAGGIGAKFDLTLNLAETGGGLAAALEYRTSLLDAATARRMLDGFAILLDGATADPALRLSELPLLSLAERAELAAWSGPIAEFPSVCLHERFAAQAGRTPEAVAVVCEGEGLSYGELSARSNRLARRLRRLGLGPESRVGLAAERSLETVVGILGILKAGGAYVPIDPSYPEERIQFLLEDSRASLLLTSEHLTDPSLEEESGEDLPGFADPDNAAYVIYTSGSTGRPKGTVVTHRNVARLFAATDGWFGFGPKDVWTLFHSFAFDFSVWEIWGALLYGGRLVAVPYWVSRTPEAFLELLEREGVTVLNQTPSAFLQLIPADGGRDLALRWVIFGGEALDLPSLAPWFDRHGDERPRLVNMYGITETTVHVSYRPLSRADLAEPWRSPVGVPIPDLSIQILDRDGQAVPVGVPGEICVGGAGLARGYLERPDLTAERYVPNPFPGDVGEGLVPSRAGASPAPTPVEASCTRLYRSGDLARWRPGGEIDYLGRIDHQVKIRGFRIELGEIEAALARHPSVWEAVVLLREEDGDRRLVAYLGTGDGEAPSPGELRTFLAGTLPDYMIPAAFAALPVLPLTAHGKVDRRALAEIRPEGGAGRDQVAPRTATEEVLAGLWASVLGVERVGVLDDFFALGGHSLLATQLVSRIREAFGVELPLRTLFEAPTVAGLAPRIEAGGEGRVLPPVARAPRDGRLPLSFSQERLWLLDQIEPGGTAYNVPAGLRLLGALRPDVLARTFGEIARRHEVLRTTFAVPGTGGEPVQVVGTPLPVPLPLVDLAGLPAADREAELRRLAWGEGGRPFDLVRGPLWRTVLVRLDTDEHALFVTMHHIVSDGWSQGVLVREIAEIYGAFSQALAPPLPELPVQYGDYAAWQRRLFAEGAMDSSLAYWRRQLAGAPVLELPTDRSRTAVADASAGGEDLVLAAGLAASLNALARRRGATLFMVVTAAFQALLARYSGQSDLTVGTPVAGRLRTELEDLIGFFVNTLVLRGDLGDDPGFGALLDRTRSAALAAFAHQAVPFERLVEEVNPERSLSHSPLFQVMVALQNTPAADLDVPGLSFRPLDLGGVDAKFDLTLTLAETGEGLAGALEYRTALFDAATVRRMAGHFAALLAGAAADPERRLSELPLMSGAERHQALVEWSRTEAVFPGEVPLQEMLARQTVATPDALALISAGERLTYRELDRRSNRLARRLRALGVGPEVPVGLFLDRSVARIVATVAVTKAGGAYVPLDPSHPRERLAFLLADTGAPVVLTESRWLDVLPESTARALCLDRDGPEIDAESGEPLDGGAPVDGLLYVMYTSGSTGRPKGVAVAHEGVARLARWAREDAGIGPRDTVLQLTAFTFDVSTMEIWGALLNGATLAIPPAGTLSLEEIGREISRHGATVLWLSAGLFQQMVDGPLESLAPLRMLIAG
ncbi:MAG TPA: amino acid adenylation domain-containing protein, partial [Thermoanaerobaculia bacterium]|nr:amino acid adenylation domain-containing protein [Thermoanaerobaculia bacterium]